MLKKFVIGLFLTIVGFATDSSADGPPPFMFVVGDSQACGARMVAEPIVRAAMRRDEQPESVISACQVGSHVAEWNGRIAMMPMRKEDYVVIYLGSNDYWSKPDPSAILSTLRSKGVTKCVWVGPPAIKGKPGPAPDHLQKVVDAEGTCKYLDSRKLDLALGDGIHPASYEEHRRWFRAALELLPRK